jgi:hypothetical protein
LSGALPRVCAHDTTSNSSGKRPEAVALTQDSTVLIAIAP